MKFLFLLLGTYLYASSVLTSLVSKNEFHLLEKSETANLKLVKQKGEFAMAALSNKESELVWSRQFHIVEFGDINDRSIDADKIRKAGLTSIEHRLGYDWMPAFYYYPTVKNAPFSQWIYDNRKKMTLNPDGPFPHCIENHYDWGQEYYYNLANQELMSKRAKQLQIDMKRSGLNGLFFDWADGGYIEEPEYKKMLQNFKDFNSTKNYYDLIGDFYKSLRESGIFFITNQAFRKNKYLLPNVTYDMTESYITSVKKVKIPIQIENQGWVDSIETTNYFPIFTDSKTIDDSIKEIDILTAYKEQYKKFGFKNFIYLNYLGPKYELLYPSSKVYHLSKPKNGIYYSYAMGKLTNNIVYAQVPYDTSLERDDVYFYDLAKPLDKSYVKVDAIHGYIRFFTKGFVLVSSPNSGVKYLKISSKWLKPNALIYDVYTNQWLHCLKKEVVVKLKYEKDTLDGKPLPLGRVYLYH